MRMYDSADLNLKSRHQHSRVYTYDIEYSNIQYCKPSTDWEI